MAKILIIDDDDQLRISFSKLLTEENYDVVSAASGEAGIEIVSTTSLDLVILDVRLPGMNGLETFKEIKRLMPPCQPSLSRHSAPQTQPLKPPRPVPLTTCSNPLTSLKC